MICFNGGTCDSNADPPACACTGGGSLLNGAIWEGPTCEDRPACSFCGADSYCGQQPNCDPSDPPDPVIAELTFEVAIETVGEEGSGARARFESDFANDISTALGISAESIVVIGITGGSVTIQFAILPDANFQLVDGTDGQFAFDPADKLTQLAAMVADPGSDLYTKEGSKFLELGQPINTPAAIPAASQGTSGELTKERCHSRLYCVLLTPCVLFQMRSTL